MIGREILKKHRYGGWFEIQDN